MRTLAVAVLLVAASVVPSGAVAAPDLDLARTRYQDAAYEDALKLLDAVEPASKDERVQIEQYRALCHIALGHTEQAERSVAALVDADPLYVPPTSIASPKVLAIVAETRRRQIPAVARRLLDSGRAAFADKKVALAGEQFALLMKVLDDPAMQDRPEAADYRTIAQGFATLLVAAPAAAAAAPAANNTSAAMSAANGGSANGAAASPAAAPANGGGSAEIGGVYARAFNPAVPITEALPQWTPPSSTVARTEYNGSLKVIIGVDGRVKSTMVVKPSHPLYDAALINVAKTWRYRPATQDGAVTESERIIAIRLRPRS